MGCLILDGVNDLTCTLQEYRNNFRESFCGCSIKRDVWCRLTLPLHFALTLIRTVCVQTLRAAAFLLSGALYLDKKRIQYGLQDLLSVVVQAIVLPILCIVTFVAPATGYRLLNRLNDLFARKRDVDNALLFEDSFYEEEKLCGIQKGIPHVFAGLTGTLNVLVVLITQVVEHLLSGNMAAAKTSCQLYVPLILYTPLSTVTCRCREDYPYDVYVAHRVVFVPSDPISKRFIS